MRRSRDRRRQGLRCLTIELRETEVTALVRKGLLMPENKGQQASILAALYEFLERTLGREVTRNQ